MVVLTVFLNRVNFTYVCTRMYRYGRTRIIEKHFHSSEFVDRVTSVVKYELERIVFSLINN